MSRRQKEESRVAREHTYGQNAAAILVAGLIGVAAIWPPAAGAPVDDGRQRREAFLEADTNHDGRLSWAEFRTAVRRILARRDDFEARGFRELGETTQDELLKERFHKMDSGGKGYLTFEDWKE
ncbi:MULTISPECIES: EF-hand domain-containing protein [Acetobacteraceae]|uniref:EF-hand domain-containing protein n=1 Tax=Acetobacteraceae TaxID=433 RepID=UPI0006994593|nr:MULTISPECIES: EF-hand domain-containing protein [Acetobacteraceae]MCG4261947.1 EF-hand domain-containing protein [Acetobacter senegalensis]